MTGRHGECFMHGETVPLIASIFVLCVICQWVAWRIQLPPILLLLLAGLAAGPFLGIIHPDQLLGDLLFPFVSLSVAIILFEGSLTLKIKEIRGLHIVVRNMVSSGMMVTWLITTIATKIFTQMSWEVATLFGAIMVVTGPTVIAPILRTVRPVSPVSNILKWESIVIDPIGATLAVLVFEFIISGGGREAYGNTFFTFSQLLVTGAAIGAFAGYFFGLCLRYHFIPEFLHNIAALGLVFGTFSLANSFQPESGLVTVTVLGIWLANMKGVDLDHILAFKETLSILLISLLFIILAARVNLDNLQLLGWAPLGICLIIQFISRPLNILISARNSTLSRNEKLFLCWIAPRGIVAAAISSLFALKLHDYGYDDAVLFVPLTFLVIIFTVLLQSLTAVPLAKLLDIRLPEPEGFLITGGNPVAIAIAKSLMDAGGRVLLADSSITFISQAQKLSIPTYLGNPISEHAKSNLNLSGIGKLLALSEHENENIAAAFHFREEFGRTNIFTLLAAPRGKKGAKLRAMQKLRGKTLFSSNVNYSLLNSLISQGAMIQCRDLKAPLSTTMERDDKEDSIYLFAQSPKNGIYFFNHEHPPLPENGWKLFYLETQHTKIESLK